MAKAELTEEERSELDALKDTDLRVNIEKNERKRRILERDRKAYASASKDLEKVLDAKTAYALEVLEKRSIERGETPEGVVITLPKAHVAIVPPAPLTAPPAAPKAKRAARA
jgi:hypothetical protein